jgi:hypothetical protein
MASLAEIRAKYPQYDDLSDQALADALHRKFYSDMPREEFDAKIGLSSDAVPPPGLVPGSPEYAKWAVEQVRAGKKLPQVSQHMDGPRADGLADKAFAASGSFIEGMPVIGGPVIDLLKQARGAVHGMTPEDVEAEFAGAKEANPITSTAAGVGGAIASLAPLGATALGGRLLGMSGSLGSRVGLGAASGGVLSGADTLTRGGDFADAGVNTGIGAALGGAIPVVGAGIRRAISPIRAPASKTAAAQTLQREGVELTAGQSTGSKGLQYREAELGGTAAERFAERQSDQFTAAALRRVGVDAPRATHEVINTAFTNIGQQFDDLAARNALQTDAQLVQDLQQAWRHFDDVTNANTRPPFVERFMQDMANQLRTGYALLPGEWFKSTRSQLARISRNTSNPELGEAARDIMHALDDAMERSLAFTNPADMGAWREARRLYRNMLVIEDAATRAGEKAADGIITPANLRNAAMKQNKRAFARGQNEFTDLADAGVSTMTPLPNSGTPGRLGAKFFLPAGAATGATVGGMVGGIPGAAVGGAIGAAVPWAAGRAMLSGPGRRYLGNQAASGLPLAPLPPAVLPLEVTRQR